MIKITKKLLKNLASDIMINLQKDELVNLNNEFNFILKQMELVQKINTTNIKSLDFPFDLTVDYLRDDEKINIASQAEILLMAPKNNDNFIIINRVIK